MKFLFFAFLLFPFLVEAKLRRGLTDLRKREPRDITNTVRLNDVEMNDRFFGKSKISLKFGPDFQRFDLENLNQEKNSFYNIDGTNFQFSYDYWFSEWLILKHRTSFSRYKLKRYDGRAIDNEEKRQYEFSWGARLTFVNLYFGYHLAKERRFWMSEISSQNISIRRIKMNAHRIEVGYRLYIYKPIALDVFYRYGLSSNREEVNVGEIKGRETQFGFKVFFNKAEETQYGVEINETINNLSWGNGQLRNKTFQILPYLSF